MNFTKKKSIYSVKIEIYEITFLFNNVLTKMTLSFEIWKYLTKKIEKVTAFLIQYKKSSSQFEISNKCKSANIFSFTIFYSDL